MEGIRSGLARTQVALIIVLIVVAGGVGAYSLLTQGSNDNIVHLSITETDAANQIDSFVPQNVTVKMGTTVNFAVFDGDDEIRVMTIAALNVNVTIDAGTTQRFSFTPDKVGTFTMFSPKTVPSAVSNGRPGSPVTGYLIVIP